MAVIVKVETGRFDYSFEGEFKFFSANTAGRISRPSVLLRLTDENGITGWGQAVPVPTWTYETVETITTTLNRYLAPLLIGENPANITKIYQLMEQAIRPGFSSGQPLCKAAVDIACFDLAARQQGKPVRDYLGKGADLKSLTLSWTIASQRMNIVEDQLEQGASRGYKNFNIKVGAPQSPEYDLALAKKVRQFAPDGFLWADANTGYDLASALDIFPKLADCGVDVMESPLPPNQLRGYQALKKQGALPVYMDEGLVTPVEAEEFIALGMMDGLTLKVARSGGLWHTRQMVDLARRYNIGLLGSGLCDPDLSLAASVHAFAWAGIDKPCALNGPQFLTDTLDTTGFIPDSGQIFIPERPGLGLSLVGWVEDSMSLVAVR